MKKNTEKKKVLARGKAISVGIDVHKLTWHLTAVSDGVVVFKGSLPPCFESLQSLFRRFVNCRIQVAYETGPFGL